MGVYNYTPRNTYGIDSVVKTNLQIIKYFYIGIILQKLYIMESTPVPVAFYKIKTEIHAFLGFCISD